MFQVGERARCKSQFCGSIATIVSVYDDDRYREVTIGEGKDLISVTMHVDNLEPIKSNDQINEKLDQIGARLESLDERYLAEEKEWEIEEEGLDKIETAIEALEETMRRLVQVAEFLNSKRQEREV